ncbi:MAG: Chromosome partition protein Smc [Mycoplasmataceae bacterium]|nr:MAG: Chromosome partition protein Smc [Mycoplasmataceae bacterium]
MVINFDYEKNSSLEEIEESENDEFDSEEEIEEISEEEESENYYDSEEEKEIISLFREKGESIYYYVDTQYSFYEPSWEEEWEKEAEGETIYQNAQNWLDKNYPFSERNQVTQLIISNKNLEGSLKIEGFIGLKVLACDRNQLTNLAIEDCPQLKIIICLENQLKQDLTTFAKLENLEYLYIENNDIFGSLQPLQNLTKLKYLNISTTCLDSGLEFLPKSLETFRCEWTKFEKKLKGYFGTSTNEKYKSFQEDQKKEQSIKFLKEENKKISLLENELTELKNQLIQLQENETSSEISEIVVASIESKLAEKEEKLRQKEKELKDFLRNSKKSTVHLRREIAYLKKMVDMKKTLEELKEKSEILKRLKKDFFLKEKEAETIENELEKFGYTRERSKRLREKESELTLLKKRLEELETDIIEQKRQLTINIGKVDSVNNYSNFTGGVNNQGNVEGSQTVNISQVVKTEEQLEAQVVQLDISQQNRQKINHVRQ